MLPLRSHQDDAQAPLLRHLDDFERGVPWAQLVCQRIRAAQFQLTHAHPLRSGRSNYWALRVKVPQHLQDGFGTAPEILLIAIRGEVQARDLAAADQEIRTDEERRLDPDLLVIISDWPELANRLEQFPAARGRCVAWQVEAADVPGGGRLAELPDVLGAALATHDLFDERDPVRGRHVIGRRDEIRHLRQQVLTGKSVGLFGLRKVGKTTLLKKVSDELDPRGSVATGASADALEEASASRALLFSADAMDITEHSLEAVLEVLQRSIQKRLELEGLDPPLSPKRGLSRFERLLDFALEATPLPLGLLIDEYDYLFEPTPIAGLSKLLRVLRAKAQASQRLAIVLAGRDPSVLQSPKLEALPNPILGWFQDTWIGPFDKDAADEALRKLGRRVGLEMGPRTLSTALEWTLGHPLLHRQFGSALWQVLRSGNKVSSRLQTDPHLEAALRAFREKDAAREVCREVQALLSERYAESYSLLRYLAEGNAEDGPEVLAMHGGWSAPAALMLRRFGLLAGTEAHPRMPRLLRGYLTNERA